MQHKKIKVREHNPVIRLPKDFFNDSTRKTNYDLDVAWDNKNIIITKLVETNGTKKTSKR